MHLYDLYQFLFRFSYIWVGHQVLKIIIILNYFLSHQQIILSPKSSFNL